MALAPVNFKLEQEEIDVLEREAKSVPRRTLSGYIREIIKKRRKPSPPRQPMPSSD